MRDIDWLGLAVWLVGAVLVVLLFLMLLVAWNSFTSPKFTLDKSEWRCTEDRIVSRLQALPAGKAVIAIPQTHYVECVRWERIGSED